MDKYISPTILYLKNLFSFVQLSQLIEADSEKEFNEKVNDILDEIGEENINDLYFTCISTEYIIFPD